MVVAIKYLANYTYYFSLLVYKQYTQINWKSVFNDEYNSRINNVLAGLVGLAPKWGRLAPKWTNPGLFQIRFQCIWRGEDLSHFGPIWPTLEPNLPSLKHRETDPNPNLFTMSDCLGLLSVNYISSIFTQCNPILTINSHDHLQLCSTSMKLWLSHHNLFVSKLTHYVTFNQLI